MKIKSRKNFFGSKILFLPIVVAGVFAFLGLKTYAVAGEDLTNFVRINNLVMNPNDDDSLAIKSVDKLFSTFNVGFVLDKQPTENSYFEFFTKGLPYEAFRNFQVKAQDGQTVIGKIEVVDEHYGARYFQIRKTTSGQKFNSLEQGDFWGARMRVTFNKDAEKFQNISFSINQKNATMGGWTISDEDYTAPISLTLGNDIRSKDVTVSKVLKSAPIRTNISHYRTTIHLQQDKPRHMTAAMSFKGNHVGKIVEVSLPEGSPIEFNGETRTGCKNYTNMTYNDNTAVNTNHVIKWVMPYDVAWTCEIVSWDKNRIRLKVLTQAAEDINGEISQLGITVSEDGIKKALETGEFGKITYTYRILDGENEIYTKTQTIDPVLIGNFEQFKTEQAQKIEEEKQTPPEEPKKSEEPKEEAQAVKEEVKAPNTGVGEKSNADFLIYGFLLVLLFSAFVFGAKKSTIKF